MLTSSTPTQLHQGIPILFASQLQRLGLILALVLIESQLQRLGAGTQQPGTAVQGPLCSRLARHLFHI